MSRAIQRDILLGALAGLAGGIVFGLAMHRLGMLVSIAGLVGSSVLGVGWGLHLLISAVIGSVFGALFRYLPGGHAASLTGGVIYGFLWWLLGPLTLMPALMRQPVVWSLVQAQATFPSLVGHLFYGAVTGLTFHLLATLHNTRLRPGWLDAVPGLGIGPSRPTQRIVILGGGFAGLAVAQRLNQVFARDRSIDVLLISESNYLLFTPMLAEVASSSLEGRHISSPMRAFFPAAASEPRAQDGGSMGLGRRLLRRQRVRFQRAYVVGINPERQTVTVVGCEGCAWQEIPYDHLVLTLGGRPHFFGLPGIEENAFTLKSLEDAERLRDHVIGQFERADAIDDPRERRRLLTFVVAGGGFSGVETIAELADFAGSVLRYYPTIRPAETRFILIHALDHILPEIGPELAEYALQKLQSRGIEFELDMRVTRATQGRVFLRDGRSIPTNTLVWTAGNQPNPLLRELRCELDRSGAVVVDETLRATDTTNVWAAGDCAHVPDPHTGQPYPPTAQHALRQGKALADNIAALLRNRPLKPLRFRTLGTLVALGHRTAVAEIRGRQFSGLLAWLMWRAVYWSKLPGAEKKIRVFLDWTIDLFFPRDIVQTRRLTTRPQPLHLSEIQPEVRAEVEEVLG
ncbi:MAG: FAD-dependent oxidoreductase [Anaerolineae bacterium]